jgi:hypothetical protein
VGFAISPGRYDAFVPERRLVLFVFLFRAARGKAET